MLDLVESVRAASQRGEVCAAVNEIYSRLQGEIDARRPLCVASGRCCRFEEFGHRLYVTTMELANFVHDLSANDQIVRDAAARPWDGTGCPFQVGLLCGAHGIRPFGCRIYFCDPSSTAWQHDAYERLHGELRRMHETLGVPYFYLEWRAALAALGLAGTR